MARLRKMQLPQWLERRRAERRTHHKKKARTGFLRHLNLSGDNVMLTCPYLVNLNVKKNIIHETVFFIHIRPI